MLFLQDLGAWQSVRGRKGGSQAGGFRSGRRAGTLQACAWCKNVTGAGSPRGSDEDAAPGQLVVRLNMHIQHLHSLLPMRVSLTVSVASTVATTIATTVAAALQGAGGGESGCFLEQMQVTSNSKRLHLSHRIVHNGSCIGVGRGR